MKTGEIKKTFSSYLLDVPAGEHGQFPFGLAYSEGDEVGENKAVEELASEHGLEVEWAGSPDEDEDGNGYWPFRVA